MAGVGNQNSLGRLETRFDNLSYDSVRIDQRLAVVYVISFAYGNDDAVTIGIGVDGHDFGDANLVAHLRTRLEQVPETGVLGFQRH